VSAPPPILEGEAAEEYRRIGALLGPPELISELDRHVLVRFAVAWETWLDAVREIKTMSPVVSSNGRLARNPYLSVAKDAAIEMNWCEMQLGLSPVARLRLGHRVGSDDEDDPWREFAPFRVIDGGK
jgi:P27 family predicted phage terminase small subunit